MSTLAERATPLAVHAPHVSRSRWRSALWPLLAAVLSSVAFDVVRPDVGDLQAALARASAASNGVGLTYWFPWFGGGATPGNYSVLTPWLSGLLGAPLVGVLATVALTPLVARALTATPHMLAGTWLATAVAGLNLWSGRIPFALGCAVAVLAVIGVRERKGLVATVAAIASSLCSPVTGAFLVFGLAAAWFVERSYRRLMVTVAATTLVTLAIVALVFGSPGPQGYAIASALLTAGSALAMLFARPARTVQSALLLTALAAPVLALIPNGMGSNFVRLPWICLPPAVLATAAARGWRSAIAVLPAVALCANATVVDLLRSAQPSASADYYQSLITQLDRVHGLANYRLEVVDSPSVHTAAFALLGHASLAGGYETQEQNALNAVLNDKVNLNAVSYKVWLDNSAVGFVAVNRAAHSDSPEYTLVTTHRLPYLTRVSSDAEWTLYRVLSPTPIVPAPERLISITQSRMTIAVPCACTFGLRIRYSKFLNASSVSGAVDAATADDGSGWTLVTTPVPGRYVLSGSVTRPLR